MKRIVISALVSLCMAGGLYAQAGGASASAPAKTGVINVQSAIIGTKDGQKASQELEVKFGPKRKEMEARQTEIRQMQEQSQKGGNLMTEDKKAQLLRDVEEKGKRLQRDTQDAQEELDQEQQRLLQGIGQRMMVIIEKYAKDNGYTMVIDVSNPNTPVLYASSAIDITQDIIGLYDKSPAPTSSAPSSGPGNAAKPATPSPSMTRPVGPGQAAPRP